MTQPLRKKGRFTFEEYLELESKAEQKSEFHAGEIVAMADGTIRHSRIGRNLLAGCSQSCEASPANPSTQT